MPPPMGTLFFLRDTAKIPLPFLAMYDCPNLVLATIFLPDGATCVYSYYLGLRRNTHFMTTFPPRRLGFGNGGSSFAYLLHGLTHAKVQKHISQSCRVKKHLLTYTYLPNYCVGIV